MQLKEHDENTELILDKMARVIRKVQLSSNAIGAD